MSCISCVSLTIVFVLSESRGLYGMLDDSAAKLYFLGDDVLEKQRAVEHTSLAAQLVAFPEVRCARIVCFCDD